MNCHLSLTVTDVKGAVVASQSVTQGQYSFDVNTWAAGTYYVESKQRRSGKHH